MFESLAATKPDPAKSQKRCPNRAVIPSKKLLKKESVDHGQLAKKGRERTFKLGQFLRGRYRVFLEGTMEKPGQVLATYVDLDSTLDGKAWTGASHLRRPGSVPGQRQRNSAWPGSGRGCDERRPDGYDVPFLDSLKANLDKALKEPGRRSYATLEDLIAFVGEKTGAPRKNNVEKFLVIDSLVTYVFSGNPVPDRAKPTLRYVLDRVLDTIAVPFEKLPDKMHLLSVSDTSGFLVLKLLDSSHASRPCFCASILIEVYRDDANYFVRVLYRTKDEPCLVPVESMGNPCELIEFLEFLRNVLRPLSIKFR
ncbi:hypothetical protein MRX96_033212 [Rhipicephalus microplus]